MRTILYSVAIVMLVSCTAATQFNATAISAEVTAAELAGSSWKVLGFNPGARDRVNIINGSTVTVNFDVDGKLTGKAGCNSYFTSYTIDGETISIGLVGATRMACGAPEGIMDQEVRFFEALGQVSNYELVGDELSLLSSDGAYLLSLIRDRIK